MEVSTDKPGNARRKPDPGEQQSKPNQPGAARQRGDTQHRESNRDSGFGNVELVVVDIQSIVFLLLPLSLLLDILFLAFVAPHLPAIEVALLAVSYTLPDVS